MLQMNCPNCKEIIRSPILAEISSVECGHCKERVPVRDVFVSSKGFVMHREDLLKRIFRYQNLLREVEEEMVLMEGNESASEATKKSIRQFHGTIQEMLAGCRKHFRLEIPYDLPTELEFSKKIIKGRLKNLSSEGASFVLDKVDQLPQMRSQVNFELTLPEAPEPLSIRAKVVWIRMSKTDETAPVAFIGVNFLDLKEKIQNCLWNFIFNSLAIPAP